MKYKILLLLIISLFSVSASCAVLETGGDDYQYDITGISEVNNTYSIEEKKQIMVEQREWYSRNYDKLGIGGYCMYNEYFDGATADLPEDPFPYKNTDFRVIAFNEKPGTSLNKGVHLESLTNYLDPAYQKALANNGVYDDGSIQMYYSIGGFIAKGNSNNTNNLSNEPLGLADNSNTNSVEDANSNGTHTVSARMETTGFPIAALILAMLVSIVVYRRKE